MLVNIRQTITGKWAARRVGSHYTEPDMVEGNTRDEVKAACIRSGYTVLQGVGFITS